MFVFSILIWVTFSQGSAVSTAYPSLSLGSGIEVLVTFLNKKFTEEEKKAFYEKLWIKFKEYVKQPATLQALIEVVEKNPELMEYIKNELQSMLKQKGIALFN